MDRTKVLGTMALILTVGVAACDRSADVDADVAGMSAEEQALGPHQEMDPAVMAQIMEIQQIQQQLEPIQREALEDEALAAQLATVQARIETAMREQGSDLFARIDRFEEDMATAEAAGNQEQIQVLMMQAQGLQQEVQALQAAVFERPDIRQPVEEFEAAQRAAMIQIDPEAEALLDRVDELMASIPM